MENFAFYLFAVPILALLWLFVIGVLICLVLSIVGSIRGKNRRF